ncbi:hypothetical protein BGZ94_006373 [Podila epigama]|nr:hypothetical protein BGZ94_006373 [Podila epigama]
MHTSLNQPPRSGSSSTSSTFYGSTRRQNQQDHLDLQDEVQELLSAEVNVEIEKLREYARHGFSSATRGEAWLFLLGIKSANRSKEVSSQRQRQLEYEQMDKEPGERARRVRGDISRFMRRVPLDSLRQASTGSFYQGSNSSSSNPSSTGSNTSALRTPLARYNTISSSGSNNNNSKAIGNNDSNGPNPGGDMSPNANKDTTSINLNIPQVIEDIICAYCNVNSQVEYCPAMINLAVPIIHSVHQDWNAYACFEHVVNRLEAHFSEERIQSTVAKFMTLFHTLLPDLYSYFEEEEVDIREWSASALRYLLSRELTIENTLRLWDVYFALLPPPPLLPSLTLLETTTSFLQSTTSRDFGGGGGETDTSHGQNGASSNNNNNNSSTSNSTNSNNNNNNNSNNSNSNNSNNSNNAWVVEGDEGWIELNTFICLALLKQLKEEFEEWEQSEICSTLMRLPALDMDQIINEAFNMRHELLERDCRL